jgi:hypothetical protein
MTGCSGWQGGPKCASGAKQEKYELPTATQIRFCSSRQHLSLSLIFYLLSSYLLPFRFRSRQNCLAKAGRLFIGLGRD